MMTQRRIDGVAWDDQPPPDDGRYIPIISAPAHGNITLTLVSNRIVGAWTHYIAPRTIPCTKGTGDCPCLADQLGSRWRGYLCAWEPQFGRLYLIELTANAVRTCNVEIADPATQLRGTVVKLYRAAKSKRAPVCLHVTNATIIDPHLPEEPDVRAALVRIWSGLTRQPEE